MAPCPPHVRLAPPKVSTPFDVPIWTDSPIHDNNTISTLKAMRSFVPDSPRTSFIAPFSPDIELRRGVILADLRMLLASRSCIHIQSQMTTFGPSKWSQAYSL